jgi:hypothetical protein
MNQTAWWSGVDGDVVPASLVVLGDGDSDDEMQQTTAVTVMSLPSCPSLSGGSYGRMELRTMVNSGESSGDLSQAFPCTAVREKRVETKRSRKGNNTK